MRSLRTLGTSASKVAMLKRRSKPSGTTNKGLHSYNNWRPTLGVHSVRGDQRTQELPTFSLVLDIQMAAS